MTGLPWASMTARVVATSPASEIVGFCTMATSYPSFFRIRWTPSHPEPSTKPPWTRTMATGGALAAAAGTAPSTVAANRVPASVELERVMV